MDFLLAANQQFSDFQTSAEIFGVVSLKKWGYTGDYPYKVFNYVSVRVCVYSPVCVCVSSWESPETFIVSCQTPY